jgi:hypothetical protein
VKTHKCKGSAEAGGREVTSSTWATSSMQPCSLRRPLQRRGVHRRSRRENERRTPGRTDPANHGRRRRDYSRRPMQRPEPSRSVSFPGSFRIRVDPRLRECTGATGCNPFRFVGVTGLKFVHFSTPCSAERARPCRPEHHQQDDETDRSDDRDIQIDVLLSRSEKISSAGDSPTDSPKTTARDGWR